MKAFVCCLIMIACAAALAGSEQIIKQRAKDLSNQNNARQGVTPPPPAPRPVPATPSVSAMPPQTPLARLHGDLLNVKSNSIPTSPQIQQFARNLMSAVQGPKKPSMPSLEQLSKSLLNAMAARPLANGPRGRLLQNVLATLNGTSMNPAQLKEVIADAENVLLGSGVPKEKAAAVATDLTTVSAQVR